MESIYEEIGYNLLKNISSNDLNEHKEEKKSEKIELIFKILSQPINLRRKEWKKEIERLFLLLEPIEILNFGKEIFCLILMEIPDNSLNINDKKSSKSIEEFTYKNSSNFFHKNLLSKSKEQFNTIINPYNSFPDWLPTLNPTSCQND